MSLDDYTDYAVKPNVETICGAKSTALTLEVQHGNRPNVELSKP